MRLFSGDPPRQEPEPISYWGSVHYGVEGGGVFAGISQADGEVSIGLGLGYEREALMGLAYLQLDSGFFRGRLEADIAMDGSVEYGLAVGLARRIRSVTLEPFFSWRWRSEEEQEFRVGVRAEWP